MNNSIIAYIVDDDIDDQEFLIEALKEVDSSVTCFTALNGQEGLNKLVINVVPLPSIIFLDLNMPRINGRQFLHQLKSVTRFKYIPVIVYTTSSDQQDVDEMKQLGAADYLVKQFDSLVLKEALSSIFSTVLTS